LREELNTKRFCSLKRLLTTLIYLGEHISFMSLIYRCLYATNIAPENYFINEKWMTFYTNVATLDVIFSKAAVVSSDVA
jgi:hypothetical protein